MLDIGVPAAASLLFEAGAFTAAAWMIGWLGATALAAHQIALSCAAFTFMFPLGISMAVSMRIGRAIGEGRRDALRPIGLGAVAMAVLVMGMFAMVFAVAGETLASWFVREADVIALAMQLLVVAAIFQLFDGSQVVGAGALRGLADVKVPTVITLIAYWGVALPAAYWLGVHEEHGAIGVWFALAAGLAIAAAALVARFVRLTAK
jgi:MATE family multidrug resistance protein